MPSSNYGCRPFKIISNFWRKNCRIRKHSYCLFVNTGFKSLTRYLLAKTYDACATSLKSFGRPGTVRQIKTSFNVPSFNPIKKKKKNQCVVKKKVDPEDQTTIISIEYRN